MGRTVEMGEIVCHIGDIDETFDEKGNTFLALRQVSWGNSDKSYLDLRKYYIDPKGGDEKISKGLSFLTEEGPHELTMVLTKLGFGHTDEILTELKSRDDFAVALSNVMGGTIPAEFTEAEELYEPSHIIDLED
jgi:hypothetical protein